MRDANHSLELGFDARFFLARYSPKTGAPRLVWLHYALDRNDNVVCCMKDLNACLHVNAREIVDTRDNIAVAQSSANRRPRRFESAHVHDSLIHLQCDPESSMTVCLYADSDFVVRYSSSLVHPGDIFPAQRASRVVPKLLRKACFTHIVFARQDREQCFAIPADWTYAFRRTIIHRSINCL